VTGDVSNGYGKLVVDPDAFHPVLEPLSAAYKAETARGAGVAGGETLLAD
jgi:hypothetical protein